MVLFFFSTAISISEIRVSERCESPPRNSDAVMNLFDPTFFTDIYTPLCLPWQGLMPAGNDVMRPNYFCKSCKCYSILPSCPRETRQCRSNFHLLIRSLFIDTYLYRVSNIIIKIIKMVPRVIILILFGYFV